MKRSEVSVVEYRSLAHTDLEAVIASCRAQGWDSYVENTEQTWWALTAPGACTVVAVDDRAVIGFVHVQGDGLIQAYVSLALDRALPRRAKTKSRLSDVSTRTCALTAGGALGVGCAKI